MGGTFYNMGTDSTGDVVVTFTDVTERPSTVIGRDTLNFSGLSQNFASDSLSATVLWNTDSADIGAHIISISADSVSGEVASDNSVDVTVLVDPRDYATFVLNDPWDMDDDSTSAWYTTDIEEVLFNWDTTSTGWTDTVSGMFEGVIEFDSSANYPFRGVISLNIPDSASKYIDTDKYHMLSMGITIDNPFVQESSSASSVLLRWWDSNGDPGCSWYGCLAGSYVSNGWSGWSEIGPIDLNDIDSLHWGDDDVSKLQLMFQTGDPVILPQDSIFSVRIGWIRLEESAQ